MCLNQGQLSARFGSTPMTELGRKAERRQMGRNRTVRFSVQMVE